MPGMTFHINSPIGGGKTFGTATVSGASGEPGVGFFRLTFRVDLLVEPAGTPANQLLPELTDLVAEVRLGGRSLGRLVAMPGFFPVKSYPARSNHAQIPMTCDLDRPRIEAIERQRAAHDLTLEVSCSGKLRHLPTQLWRVRPASDGHQVALSLGQTGQQALTG